MPCTHYTHFTMVSVSKPLHNTTIRILTLDVAGKCEFEEYRCTKHLTWALYPVLWPCVATYFALLPFSRSGHDPTTHSQLTNPYSATSNLFNPGSAYLVPASR